MFKKIFSTILILNLTSCPTVVDIDNTVSVYEGNLVLENNQPANNVILGLTNTDIETYDSVELFYSFDDLGVETTSDENGAFSLFHPKNINNSHLYIKNNEDYLFEVEVDGETILTPVILRPYDANQFEFNYINQGVKKLN
ncbi:hypothetical protein [Psychroflexus sp. ALD_RP9]|uniref:hypothetical protein n=1 Tax=Psychroflexus sp. ALD_RP9 TaxID=2777186 RepID=UPI001A8C2CD9|nr:hypothetical protein [Psychroflexus sp. ALD_RP9]QSS97440.1 hypothetical protein IMZ30_01630 [Psychroflexus sp. ALD_RP9]